MEIPISTYDSTNQTPIPFENFFVEMNKKFYILVHNLKLILKDTIF